MPHRAPLSQSESPPFFIVGCGRSGTSLLRGILNRHSQIAIPLESLFIADYLRSEGRVPLPRLKDLIVNEPEIREWGLQASRADLNGCESIGQVISRLHRLYAGSHGKTRWGQKTPRLVRELDLLKAHFPDAKFLHVIRDPRAVASSLTRSNVHRSTPLHATRRWLRDVGAGLDFERSNPAQVLRIRYEDLVAAPEPQLDRALEFLGVEDRELELDPSPESGEYSEFYSEIHRNLSLRPTDEFVDRWRHDLSAPEIGLVESLAAKLMGELGYQPTHKAHAVSAGVVRAMRLRRMRGMVQQLWHYLRYRRAYLSGLLLRKYRLGMLREFFSDISY